MKTKPRILFRADGNSQIGLGHVVRSLALAEMLNQDFECLFAIQQPSQALQEKILAVCQSIIPLPDLAPANPGFTEELLPYLTGKEIVVLDGYNFNTAYQKSVKANCLKLVCIDDIHAYHFVADAVINHIEGIPAEAYSKEPYSRLYLGFKYALLRREFLQVAREKVDHPAASSGSVLICLGGADPENLTLKVLVKCLQIDSGKTFSVIIGAAYPHTQALQQFIENTKANISILTNLGAAEMIWYMQQSAEAITSASTISYEYLSAGNGTLFLLKTADNQAEVYDYLIRHYFALPFEDYGSPVTSTLKEDLLKNARVFNGQQEHTLQTLFKDLVHEKI